MENNENKQNDILEEYKKDAQELFADGKAETSNLGEDIKKIKDVNFKNLSTNAKLALGSLVVAIISLFLPIYKISFLGLTHSISFIDGDGKIILFLLLVAGVFFVIKRYVLSLLPIIISFLMYIYAIVNIKSKLKAGTFDINLGKFGTGLYLGMLALIAAIYFIYKTKLENKSYHAPNNL